MKKTLLEKIEDRFHYLYRKVGANEKVLGDIEVRELCKAYQLVFKDLEVEKIIKPTPTKK